MPPPVQISPAIETLRVAYVAFSDDVAEALTAAGDLLALRADQLDAKAVNALVPIVRQLAVFRASLASSRTAILEARVHAAQVDAI